MPRAKAILQSEFPYHITARTINRDWFQLPMDFVWQVFCDELWLTNMLYDLQIHSFLLMDNHFHLIASTPQANVSDCMYYFMKNTSLRLTRAGNRINQTFGGRHYKTILHSENYYLNAYKYVYQNPLVAKKVGRVEEYPYSTLAGLLGDKRLQVPLVADRVLVGDLHSTLEWLNQSVEEEKREAVKWALRRPHFKSKKCRKSNKPILSEHDIV